MIRIATPLALLALTAPAFAQDPPDDMPPLDDDAPEEPAAYDEPPPVARTTSEPVDVPPPPPMQVQTEAPGTGRPDGFSIGIGLGYDLPADLQAPNRTSVRFRLANGVTVEPFAALAFSVQSQDDGVVDTSTNTLGLELGADVRLPKRVRGPVDLVLVGGGGLGLDSTNPEGDDNNTSTFFVELHWGLGLEYWFKDRWVMSLTATNPFLSSSRTTQEGNPQDMTSSTTNIGAIWEPNVVAMFHLFL